MADRGAVGFQGVQGPATTPTAKPARQPKPTKGPVGFQGPIGINNVVDQSPADGFALPPNIYTHPNGHNVIDPTEIDTGAFATRSAGNLSPTSASSQLAGTGFAPRNTEFANPWNQEGITPPKSKVKIDPRFGVPANEVARMQATQRSLAILEAAPSLKSHPDIVAALAFNADIPFTPQIVKLIATIQKARSAVNYSQDFTPKDYAQMDLLLHPEKFKSHDRLSQMMDSYTTGPEWSQKLMQAVGPMSPYFAAMEGLNLAGKGLHAGSVGLGITVESRTENLPDGITVKAKPNGSLEWFDKDGKPLSSSKAAMIDLDLAGTTGTLAAVAGAPGKVVINPSAVKKAVVQFAADQFDTPQHMYRFIASVQSKYGAGYAALALAPMFLGGAAGTMLGGLGGRAGVEITGAAEEALVNLIAKEGFSDLAATSLTGQALADAEALQAEVIATMTARQAAAKGTAGVVEKIATPVGKVAMSGVRGLNKVITSPTLAGADVGFTVGGQGLFRQEYMDSRDGTVWAKKNPKLASTIGRWATQNFDDGWLKTGLSGALDALAAVAVPDAIGAIGRMKGIARSAEGFQGGLLSGRYTKEEIAARQQAKIDKYEQQLNAAVANGTFEQFLAKQLGFKGKLKNTAAWFGKVYDARALNVNNAYVKAGGKYRTGTALNNIDRAYNESPSVRSTVNLIAQTGSASAIMGIDPRFAAYSDLLAEARVLNADGTVNMTESVENVKRVFRDSQTAEALLDPTRNMPLSFMPYSGSNVRRKIGATIKVIDKNGLTKELPLYTNLKELKMENRKFSPGDRNSLPAISSWITLAYGRGVAEQVVNELAKTTDPQIWENVIVNTMAEANYQNLATKLTSSGIPQIVIDEMLKGAKGEIKRTLRQIFNFGGPGSKGHYGSGVMGMHAEGIMGETLGKSYANQDLSFIQSHVEKIIDDLAEEARAAGVVPTTQRTVMNLDPADPLAGANHPIDNVAGESDNVMAAGIVPSDTGSMMLPSYQHMDRINETFVKLMQKRYKDVIDTPKNIAKLENDLLKLNEALQKASTPGQAARIQKQIDKAEASLDIQRQIAALPLDIKALDASWLEKTATKIGTTHDVVNHYYNDLWFKSLALLTGGWATRTGMSEAALNIMRQGPLNYTASRLSASVARQERAIFHVGKKFTRQAAEDIAARIYHVIKENDMLDPAGKVFGTEEEMHAAVANIRRVANEINANFDLTKEEILKAIQTEERNMSDMTMNKAVARSRGVVIGLKRAAVKSLGKDELLDAAIKLMYMNDGHIVSPMLNATHAGVAQDMQVSGNTSEEIDAATYERPLIGKNRGLQEGHHSRVYHSVAGTRHRFAGDLFYRSQRMVNDEVYHQTIQDYAKAYESAKAMLIAKGGMTEEQISAAAADMAGRSIHLQVQKRLAELSPDVRAALIRTRRPLDPKNPLAARNQKAFYDADGNFMLDPETEAAFDHATAVIKSAEGTYRFVQSGAVNEKLLYAIAQDRLPEDLNRFKKLFMTDADGKAIPANRFNSVPGPELDHAKYGFIEKVLTNTVGRATNVIHRKALGPIVNRLTRDPIYIVDFAAERRLLEPMVKDGRLTRDQADVLAQSRASVNTMKYIHNPKNKLKFENMMRLWAPFYFAENQAWRRLGRLALTNPGAAEQYTKAMYAVQDAVFQENEKNSNMSIPIPGTSWLNKYVLGPVFTGALSLTSGRFEPHLGTDQGLEFNPSSLRTVFPWASEGGGMPGIGSLISSFIPKGGPILSIPAGLYLQHAAGVLPFADEFLAKQVVGDAGLAQSMLLSLIAPNAIIANAIKIGVGMAGAGGEANQNLTNSGVMSKVSSSFVAAESMAIVSVLDNMQQKALEEAKQETAQLLKSYKKGDWQKDKNKNSFQYFMDLGGTPAGWATKLMTEKMMAIVDPSDASKYQDFRDMVNSQTTAIMNEKLVIAGISPFSIQVGRAHPELNKEWQDLVTKEGSIINALPKWYKKYPWATAETLYTTQATTGFGQSAQGVSYPTQPEMGKWMLERMDDIRSHPSAMRWVVPSELESPKDGKGGYDQMAHMLQMSLQLRAQKAPEGMIKTYRDSMFNQFVYGTLQPWGQKLIKQGWTVTQVNNFLLHNETNWKNKPRSDWSLLEQFGKTFAPQAFEDYRSGQGATNRSNAMEQLIKVTNDPAMVKKYPTFGLIKKILLPDAEDLKKIKANIPPNSTWGDTNIPYRDGLAQAWQGRMDELEAQHPELSAVITQLFRPLAPVFTND